MHVFTGFMTEPIKEITIEIVDMTKKVESEGFQDIDLEDDLMEVSASEPVPDNEEEDVEEAVRGNKLTLDSLPEGFQLFKIAFHFFYNMDPSMTWALGLNQTVGGVVLYGNIFREVKKQKKSDRNYSIFL